VNGLAIEIAACAGAGCRLAAPHGVSLNFSCSDALAIYREAATRGIHIRREPQVGNFSWEVVFTDPDGYSIHFSGPTDLPEETLLSDVKA
jgi:predicted enzyme related to lactoylglutathione lyase